MKLKIGTRKSALALWQANHVAKKLHELGVETEIVKIVSFGDVEQDLPLHKLGDKGVFTKALDHALLEGSIDLAVHSLKDVPTELPEGLLLVAVPERANPFDVLVKPVSEIEANGARTVATGSIRRNAFWKHRFPEDEVVGLRGNVPTRIQKVDESQWHGAVFAYAGLERLELHSRISEVLDWMIPAPAQGAIGIVSNSDSDIVKTLDKLNHTESRLCVGIERGFLNTLDAGCSSAVGALATVEGRNLKFVGAVLSPDGSQRLDLEEIVPIEEANEDLGRKFASVLLEQGADKIVELGQDNE